MPEVKIENPPYQSYTVSVRLQKTDDQSHAYFRLLEWQLQPDNATLDAISLPSFSAATGLFEIPVVRVNNQNDFIAQFKQVKSNNDFTF